MRIGPPWSVSKQQAEEALAVLGDALQAVDAQQGGSSRAVSSLPGGASTI
jgi:hypothetical protein